MKKLEWRTEKRKINDLIPFEHNPRKMTEDQVEQLKKSLSTFGLVEIPVIDVDNVLVAGHQRMKVMQLLGHGDDEIDVRIPNRKLTEQELKEYNVRSNKNTGEWDFEQLAGLFDENELRDIGFTDLELGLIDFDDENSEKDDAIPEEPVEAQTKEGDLYELGAHRVLCGDSTKIEDIERLMNGKKADLYLTDPPYNVAYTGKTKDALTIENDQMSDDSFKQFLVDAFTGAFSYMKPGAVFYIWHADSEGYNFRGAIHDIGQKVRQCLIWNKNSMVLGRQDYHWKHEPCLYGWKEGDSHLWNSDRSQTTVLNFDRPSVSKSHPTMKPVELIAYQITNNTKGEDIVLDTFLGSGSTLIASEKKGRICYGLELDPRYCDVIVERYVEYTGNNEVVKNGKKVKWSKKNAS